MRQMGGRRFRKIPRTRDKASLDRCGLVHRYKKKNRLLRQNLPKNKLFFPRRYYTLYKQKFSNLRPLLSITFPREFLKSKKFGHGTSGSGGKKTFKRSEQMKKKNP